MMTWFSWTTVHITAIEINRHPWRISIARYSGVFLCIHVLHPSQSLIHFAVCVCRFPGTLCPIFCNSVVSYSCVIRALQSYLFVHCVSCAKRGFRSDLRRVYGVHPGNQWKRVAHCGAECGPAMANDGCNGCRGDLCFALEAQTPHLPSAAVLIPVLYRTDDAMN